MASVYAIDTARRRIADFRAATALFAPVFAGLAHEVLSVAHLDADLGLIRLATLHGGSAASVEMPLRMLMAEALAVDAHALIVAHNHPHGDPAPSRADKAATRRLVETARLLDIRVIDHLIFAGDAVTSFRGSGLL
jgi:DNA repair protein RadC